MASKDRIEEAKAAFLQEYERNGCNISAAARRAGIDRKSIYNWSNPDMPQYDQAFAEKMADLTEEVCDNVESAMYKTALDGNVTAQVFILTNRRPQNWRSSSQVQVTGNMSHKVSHGSFTYEEAKSLLREAGHPSDEAIDLPEE